MKFKFKALGHEVAVNPAPASTPMEDVLRFTQAKQDGEYTSPVNEAFIHKLSDKLQEYAQGKKNLESKIIENDKWYRSQHWDLFRGKKASDTEPEPVTAFLFNMVANKHADAMDFYPQPNILEREESDRKEAERQSNIIPLVLEMNNYRKTYDDAWWYKLKQGCVPYGIFWNPSLADGMGDIDIVKLDLLNLYWKPGITNIQDSPVFFNLSLQDDDLLVQQYPQLQGRLGDKVLDIKTYFGDDTINTSGQSIVVDAYYKQTRDDGKTIVQLTKFVNYTPLESTEDDAETAYDGLYDHGMYPIIFDVLFPEENTPIGFGFIDIAKNPQMYIDKLDQIIERNGLQAGKQRYLVKEGGAINETELADFSKDIIHTKGGVKEGEDYGIFQGKPLPAFIPVHRQNKINELKETTGNRDFQQGGTSGGVTAASAIYALQEAGNKLSRDMIGASYNVYAQTVYMCLELIRQFYDEPRKFRITNTMGDPEYVSYTNEGLKPQPLPPDQEGDGLVDHPTIPGAKVPGKAVVMEDGTQAIVPDENYQVKFRKPIFDVKVKPEKASPFSQISTNEQAKELFKMGAFSPQRATEAKIMLEMMVFDGKDKILKKISENGDMYIQMQQLTTKLGQMTQIMAQMNEVIKRTTGKDMLAGVGMVEPGPGQSSDLSGEQGGEVA